MSLNKTKRSKVIDHEDKQNVPFNFNQSIVSRSKGKEPIKMGIEIRNKIKNKNAFKPSQQNKKVPQRKNTHLLQKVKQKKINTQKRLNEGNVSSVQRDDTRSLSNASSVKSFKSVTFSIDFEFRDQTPVKRKDSILKNKLQSSRNTEKKSLTQLSCSNIKTQDQSNDNIQSNAIILQKYEKILHELRQNRQKYTDPIYPPCEQSIFLKTPGAKEFMNKLTAQGYKIKWIRLTELYSNCSTCIWHPVTKCRVTAGFIHSSGKESQYFQTVLNSINKSYMMEKFFENQSVSKEGIYFVKMHQTQLNQWKYVIVDDWVPVIVSLNKRGGQQKIIKPAFLNVQSQNGIIELWPYLLNKAFAKYYSTFDSLLRGNSLDFLQQVTGSFYKSINLGTLTQNNHQHIKTFDKVLKNPYTITLAQTSDGWIYPFRASFQQLQILDIQNNYKSQTIGQQHFLRIFSKVHFIEPQQFTKQITCQIKHDHLLEKSSQIGFKQNQEFFLRSFSIEESTNCLLSLVQRQQRFHRIGKKPKNKKGYTYSWMRIILVAQQPNGYRWIDAAYSASKTLKIETFLQPGTYFAIIIPEWNDKPYDLKLALSSNTQTVIERKSSFQHPCIIEQSCMDLAQRFGKLIQINNNICSYNYIDYTVGFIIQNINNEKSSGDVKILRTIDGLEEYKIKPINREFLLNKKLQIKISSMESYTVVLKVTGGVDRTFLEQFDFGV